MLTFDKDGWLFLFFFENKIHDIGILELNDLLHLAYEEDCWSKGVRENVKRRMTDPAIRNSQKLDWVVEDLMIKSTGGTVITMPFGEDIITFNSNRHFFRGENQQYSRSVPSLLRRVSGKTAYEAEIIKSIAVMRSFQFLKFIWQINVVPYWEAKISDINFDALAQQYGFDTCLLDLTNDFRSALFFATCKYDYTTDSYRPLSKADIEKSESSKYGVIFHTPNWVIDYLNGGTISWHMEHINDKRDRPYTFYSGDLDGMAFQIGYQPLMRCHHQSGYIMPMMKSRCLQEDARFEKMRFLQSEELSNQVFEMMDKGKKVFPNEGIKLALDTLRCIQKSSAFSEDDMSYAYDFGEIDKKIFPTIDDFKKGLCNYRINGKAINVQKDEIEYHIDSATLEKINEHYDGKNLLDMIGNMINVYPEQKRYREQRCIEIYGRKI